jgi:predicted dithiol-disulfide oxidoreductase (DUF899 family)
LPELFDGRSQLLVYHFMFGPIYAAAAHHAGLFNTWLTFAGRFPQRRPAEDLLRAGISTSTLLVGSAHIGGNARRGCPGRITDRDRLAGGA